MNRRLLPKEEQKKPVTPGLTADGQVCYNANTVGVVVAPVQSLGLVRAAGLFLFRSYTFSVLKNPKIVKEPILGIGPGP